mgnify:CR=1 FL=1
MSKCFIRILLYCYTVSSPAIGIAIWRATSFGGRSLDLFPGLNEEILRHQLATPGVKGIVLRSYGAGNAPTSPWFVNAIREGKLACDWYSYLARYFFRGKSEAEKIHHLCYGGFKRYVVARYEVEIREKYVYISVERAETVRVYTILGQLVTQKEIQPGTIRLQLPTRGVYILKTDTATLRNAFAGIDCERLLRQVD